MNHARTHDGEIFSAVNLLDYAIRPGDSTISAVSSVPPHNICHSLTVTSLRVGYLKKDMERLGGLRVNLIAIRYIKKSWSPHDKSIPPISVTPALFQSL